MDFDTVRKSDDFISACLRGDSDPLRIEAPPADVSEIVERIRYHGVQGLLYASPVFRKTATEISQAISRYAMADAISEMFHKAWLCDVVSAMAQAEIPVLILKGSAIAYLFHHNPATRPRCDTDLFVPEQHRNQAGALLEKIGFQSDKILGPVFQQTYSIEHNGISYDLDLHWRAANSELVSRAFEFDRLWETAQPIAELHPDARAPSSEALLCFVIAHFQRDAQYRHGARFIWLHDIALIARSLNQSGWEAFCNEVVELGLGGVARRSLNLADQKIGNVLTTDIRKQLGELPEGKLSEYLSAPGYSRFIRELSCRSPGDAIRYLYQAAFPSKRFLRAKYGSAPTWKLPYLYAIRGFDGATRSGGNTKR